MAIMIPEHAVGSSKFTETLYRNLSQMLGSGYKVTQHLDSKHSIPLAAPYNDVDGGSLFWVKKANQSLFIYISDTRASDIGIDKTKTETLAIDLKQNSEIKQILKLQQDLLPQSLYQYKASLAPFLVLFPESKDAHIKLGIKSHGLYLGGNESLEPDNLLTLLRTYMGMSTSGFVINHLRSVFSPEVIMPSDDKETNNIVLLDEDQEIAAKSEITLPINARRSQNYNLRVLNGAPGSGKTQVLIHRTRFIRKLFPRQTILILCHNQAIKQSLESQYQQLNPNDRKINISSFQEWCRKRLTLTERVVYEKDISEIIDTVINRQLNNEKNTSKITKSLFLSEVNFIKGRLIFTETDYLQVRKEEHISSISEKSRKDVWRAFMALNNTLAEKNMILWSDIPRLLLESTQAGKLLERFDHILVDEAQYFAPIHYELIKKSLKPHSGQLYITYDENQGFLNNRIHLKDTGLDLRGHSMRLLSSYRVNPAIMRAAHTFHLKRLPEESDDIFFSSDDNGRQKTQNNEQPQLLHFPTNKDQETRLLKELHNLLLKEDDNSKDKIEAKDILVLTTDPAAPHLLSATIRTTLKLAVSIPTLSNSDPEALQVCSLESATGLEAPYVFITGIERLFETEHQDSLSNKQHHSLVIENTRKLYMGMTRARQNLTLMLASEKIPAALITPHISIPTQQTEKNAKVRYLHG